MGGFATDAPPLDAAPEILVGMSGGVDSSVTALLLQEQGWRVTGTTMRLFTNEDAGLGERGGDDRVDDDPRHESTCCSVRDIDDARSVARRLDIPYFVSSFTDAFRRDVIDRFIDEYRHGRTPNPCIDCNRSIKFPLLLRRARELGISHIATGHYAVVGWDVALGRYTLARGIAPKDQSYVLYALTQDELSALLLPLGELQKPEVRAIASHRGLTNAEKADSEDICFVPDGDYARFLCEQGGLAGMPGPIVDATGKVLGRHEGLFHYTVGQRRGIGVAGPEPYYVLGFNRRDNALIVGSRAQLGCASCLLDEVNWLSVACPTLPVRVQVKTRYRQQSVPATVTALSADTACIDFDEPLSAVACGQAAVFYGPVTAGEVANLVYGGGTIVQTIGSEVAHEGDS